MQLGLTLAVQKDIQKFKMWFKYIFVARPLYMVLPLHV